jgi:transposase
MNKSKFFTGQPIFTQLLQYLSKSEVNRLARQNNSDRYYKKFTTHSHLIAMLYCCYEHCTSLREVVTGMHACEGKLQSLHLQSLPARSTFSEANKHRNYEVFESIYYHLFERYRQFLPDSRIKKDLLSRRLVMIDSTTISLFREILKGAGTPKSNGKKKGGIKVHMAVRSSEDVPCLVRLTPAAQADAPFLKNINLNKGSIVVMDRGYNGFSKLIEWTNNGVWWVTRLRNNTYYELKDNYPVNQSQKESGILQDQCIIMGAPRKRIQKVRCRLIKFYDKTTNKQLSFITNNFRWKASKIASIYKRRWQIELLFKRLKQNTTLEYFLGDNENAIKIQIFCSLIADLLLKLATARIKRHWAHSNLASLIRLHLMNYTKLIDFLENPYNCTISDPVPKTQLQLFEMSG